MSKVAWPPRIVWLPALAALIPCAFMAVVGLTWLRFERQTAALRSERAAEEAVHSLRTTLEAELRSAGERVAAAVSRPGPRTASPALADTCRPLCADAFVFDDSGRRLDYDDGAAFEEMTADAARSLNEGDAGASVRRTDAGVPRALVLLALARLSAAKGDLRQAERYAAQLDDCCLNARDEHGAAIVLYSAWQRLAWYTGLPEQAAKNTELASKLEALVRGGYLVEAPDVASLRLLAERSGGQPLFVAIADQAGVAHQRTAARRTAARLAAAWVATAGSSGAPHVSSVRVARLADLPESPAAHVVVPSSQQVVMPLDREQLDKWLVSAAASYPNLALHTGVASAEPGAEPRPRLPIFGEWPDLSIEVRPWAESPTDVARRRVVMLAVGGLFLLTIGIGGLAWRDVLRGLRLAQMRSAFVTGVSHDLRTPVASIRLLAETLHLGRARQDADPEIVTMIVQEADRLGRLVDNLLMASGLETGVRQYRRARVSLSAAVRAALRRLDPFLVSEGFSVIEAIEDQPLDVDADPDALEQVVLNLVGNAVKYSAATRHLTVRVQRVGGHGVVEVADRGIGIETADLGRIFDRFYRTPAAAAHATGAGLGLALVRHFADAHDGRVDVRSTVGVGTVVSLTLLLVVD